MDPVSLTVGLVTTVVALAYKLHQLITECEIAGDQFDDLVCQFDSTKAGLERLNSTFSYTALPATQLAEYKSEAAKITTIVKYIEAQLQEIRYNLNSPRLITRIRQKKNLADGELRRFTTKLANLGDSLIVLDTTYKRTNTLSNEDRLTKMEFAMKEMESAMREIELRSKSLQHDINIDFQFIQVATVGSLHYDLDEALRAHEEQWSTYIPTSDSKPSGPTPSPKTVVNDPMTSVPMKAIEEDFRRSGWPGALGLDWAEDVQKEAWAMHVLFCGLGLDCYL